MGAKTQSAVSIQHSAREHFGLKRYGHVGMVRAVPPPRGSRSF